MPSKESPIKPARLKFTEKQLEDLERIWFSQLPQIAATLATAWEEYDVEAVAADAVDLVKWCLAEVADLELEEE